MDVSVIIINYNVKNFLEQAIVAIEKSVQFAAQGRPGFSYEIIVVDNASDDGSVDMLRNKFPEVTTIENEKNAGFARANNQALRAAKGDYILLINPDTLVQEDTIGVMIDFLEKNDDVGMCGCKILNPDGSLQLACRRSFPRPWIAFTKIVGLSRLFPRSRLFGGYNLTYLDPDESYEVDAISGSFMMIRKEVYNSVGGLDETFFMYGEDLDWCFRIQQAGWKIYYTPDTCIIHYKGESTKRSDIDAIRTFYQAMALFVEKHISKSKSVKLFLRGVIRGREFIAWIGQVTRRAFPAIIDFIFLNLSVILAELIWLNRIFHFPAYAYPTIHIVPPAILIAVTAWMGGYIRRPFSISRSAVAVLMTFVFISAITFFFREYAFSRMVVLIAGILSLITIPGWRMMLRLFGKIPGVSGLLNLAGKRTLVVGIGSPTENVIKKVRNRIQDNYQIIGLVDKTRERLGEKLGGVPIIGSIAHINKLIDEERITDVIFISKVLLYSEILTAISRTKNRSVNYMLIPTEMEVVIGKGAIDQLDDLPMVEIEYQINQPLNRVIKRMFDLFFGMILLFTLYFGRVIVKPFKKREEKKSWVDRLPMVIRGEMSFVGPPEQLLPNEVAYLGKPGITGLVQIQGTNDLQIEDIQRYNLYYAKNQSILMDVEILIKSFILHFTSNKISED